jgi:hypothetical protein
MAKKSDFIVFQEMSENNMDIACAVDITNFQRVPKKNGGTVTIGVASPHFDHLINQAATGKITHHALLYIVNKEQYDKIKKAPDEEDEEIDPIAEMKEKAEKWDALQKKMDSFYEDGSGADLGAFGYL